MSYCRELSWVWCIDYTRTWSFCFQNGGLSGFWNQEVPKTCITLCGQPKLVPKRLAIIAGRSPPNVHTVEKGCQWFCWSKSLVKSTRQRHLSVHFVAQCLAPALQSLFTFGTTAFLRQNGADDIKKHRWFKTIDWEAVPQRKLKVRAAARRFSTPGIPLTWLE